MLSGAKKNMFGGRVGKKKSIFKKFLKGNTMKCTLFVRLFLNLMGKTLKNNGILLI